MTTNIIYDDNGDVFLDIEHREHNKTFKCRISLDRYVDIFNKVLKKWNEYIEASSSNDISTAEAIQKDYKIPYAAASDIAQTIALAKSINS